MGNSPCKDSRFSLFNEGNRELMFPLQNRKEPA